MAGGVKIFSTKCVYLAILSKFCLINIIFYTTDSGNEPSNLLLRELKHVLAYSVPSDQGCLLLDGLSVSSDTFSSWQSLKASNFKSFLSLIATTKPNFVCLLSILPRFGSKELKQLELVLQRKYKVILIMFDLEENISLEHPILWTRKVRRIFCRIFELCSVF
jgi:hypothetical protein